MAPPVTQTGTDAGILAALRARGFLVEQGSPADSAAIETAVRAVPGIDRETALGFVARLRGDPALGPLIRWRDTSPWPTDVPGISAMSQRALAIREGLIHPFAYFSGQGSDYLGELETLRSHPAAAGLYADLKPLADKYLARYGTDIDQLFALRAADKNQDLWKTYFGINRAGVSFGMIALVQALRIRVMESYGYDFRFFKGLSGQSAGVLAALFAGGAFDEEGLTILDAPSDEDHFRGFHSIGGHTQFVKLAFTLGDKYEKKFPVPDYGSWPEKRENAPWLDGAGKPLTTKADPALIHLFFTKYQFVNMSISGIPYDPNRPDESALGKIINAINTRFPDASFKLRVSNVNTSATADGKNSHYIVMIGTPAALAELASMIVLKDAEGYDEEIRRVAKGFEGDQNVRLPILKTFVTIAAHNPDIFTDAEIDSIMEELRAEGVSMRSPLASVYANDDGRDMSKLPAGTDLLRDTVVQVMARPVNGPLMFERAIASGADEVITPGPGAYFSGTVAPAVIGNRPIPVFGVVGPADKSDGVTPLERLTTSDPGRAFKGGAVAPAGAHAAQVGAEMVYDLVVIGGGPGGYHAAVHAAEQGLRVLLIEKNEELGGTCLHAGCIPSKAYLTDAEWATVRGGGTVDFQKIWERKEGVVHKLAAGIKGLLSSKRVDVVLNQGEAMLNPVSADGRNLVTVGNKTYEAKKILLATGTSPVMPPFPFNGTSILTTDELFKIQKLPEKLMIVGGGVIGVEMACAFAAFGSEVTLVEALPEILSTEDPKAAKQLRGILEKRGVKIITGTSVQTLAETPEGPKATLANGVGWTGNIVLVSIGRRVSRETSAALNALGIETTDRGFAKVDDDLRTSRAGVFAIGDLSGKTLLAHGAMEEGEHVAEVVAGKRPGPVRYDAVPRITYTFPEIASIGKREQELRDAGVSFVTGRANYAVNGRALAAGHGEGFVQIYVAKEGDEAGKILGALIVGEQAETLIQLINQAMRAGDTIHDIARANPGHPTYSEIVWEAAKEAAKKVPVVARARTSGLEPDNRGPHPLFGQSAPSTDSTQLPSLEEAALQALHSLGHLLPGREIDATELERKLYELGLEEHQIRAFMVWLKGREELAPLVTGTSSYWNADEQTTPEARRVEFFEHLLGDVEDKKWFRTYASHRGGGDDLLREVAAAAMEAGALLAAADENPDAVLETAVRALWRQLRSRPLFRDFMASFGNGGPLVARLLLAQAAEVALRLGVMQAIRPVQTPYWNTEIPVSEYRGDVTVDALVTSINRYNAVVMVMRVNRDRPGAGGHLATGQSVAALRQVLFNNFLRPQTDDFEGDVFMNQGHDSPLDYVDAFLRGYLTEENLLKFREEPGGGGLSGYFHARGDTAFPAEWATVSMGLAPQLAIQVAYTDRYRRIREQARNPDRQLPPERHVWIMLGDASMAEPESVADIHFAAEERLDNLTYIINVNTNGLDGVIERHGQIMQNMERRFSGAGWKVIKLVTSGLWDHLLAVDQQAIMQRWTEMTDGELQELTRPAGIAPGQDRERARAQRADEIRELFFGKNDRLRALVANKKVWDYDRLRDLFAEGRGGHDLQKIHDAYAAALAHRGTPTVIAALTTKGRGMGMVEAANTVHNMKTIEEKFLLDLAHKLGIPLSDEEILALKFYHPGADSDVVRYLKERDAALGGGDFYFGRPPDKPRRRSAVHIPVEELPKRALFEPFYRGDRSIPRVGETKLIPDDGHTLNRYLTVVLPTHQAGGGLIPDPRSTTRGDILLLEQLMGDEKFGKHVTFIVADEITTFGGQTLPPKYGYFDPMSPITMAEYRAELSRRRRAGDTIDYTEPVFARDGQIIQVGISEARAIAALTALGKEGMMPVWMVYSAFGWRRVGDQIMAATDMRVRGVIVGATAGGSTLKGEGLLHQERADLLMAAANPAVVAYDCAFVFEKAVLWEEAIQRMYGRKEDVLYYLTAYNENFPMPAMPNRPGIREGIIKGGYKFASADEVFTPSPLGERVGVRGRKPLRVNLLGSGTLLPYALEAQRMLEKYGVHGDVFSITSYSELRRDALDKQRQKDLHRPGKSWDEVPESERPYVMNLLGDAETPVVAVTDYLKQVPDQVDRWVSRYYRSLGTDGFGRSGTHPTLRDYYEITAKYIVYHSLCLLAEKGEFFGDLEKIRAELGIDPHKADPASADPKAARLEAEALASRRVKDAVPSALAENNRTKRINDEKILAVLRVDNQFTNIEVLPDGRFKVTERRVELFIREVGDDLVIEEASLNGRKTRAWAQVIRSLPHLLFQDGDLRPFINKPIPLNHGWKTFWQKIADGSPEDCWDKILFAHSWILEISKKSRFNEGLRDVARQVEGTLGALTLGTETGRYKMSPKQAEIVRGKLELIARAVIPPEAKRAIIGALEVLDQFVQEPPRGGRGPKGASTQTSATESGGRAGRGVAGVRVHPAAAVVSDEHPRSGRGRGSGTGRGRSGGERASSGNVIEFGTGQPGHGEPSRTMMVDGNVALEAKSVESSSDLRTHVPTHLRTTLRIRLAQVASQRGLPETASLILRLSEEQLTEVVRKLPRVEARSRVDQVLTLFAKHSGSSVEQQIIAAQSAPRATTGMAVNPVVTGSTTAISQAARTVLPVLR